jgi:hypothetical protein
MTKNWTHIRVSRATRERLTSLLAVLAQGDGAYKPEYRHDEGAYVSLDQAINILLDRDESHRKRARKAAKSRGKGKLPPEPQQPLVGF